ncbi:MAG: hypothetical protein M3O28_00185 [Actinomycetota bacterium]|nr:hypothetical protein [Actinomycetota bacterium]
MAKASKQRTVVWTAEPAAHDYPAAESYLRLVAGPDLARVCSALLSQAPTVQQHAKDILRAARLPLLPADDAEVVEDLKKVAKGIALSPVLVVRGDVTTGRPAQIADGYHRVCASYHLDETTDVPCRLISLPAISV